MIKFVGALLVIAGCGGFGLSLAIQYKKEVEALRQLIKGIDYLICELQYRQPPLAQACRLVGGVCDGSISAAFLQLAAQLESQVSPDAQCCVRAALNTHPLPRRAERAFFTMGDTLGIFHLEGQLRGLQAVQNQCERELSALQTNRTQRLRSYQTLGLCAGAALVILLI